MSQCAVQLLSYRIQENGLSGGASLVPSGWVWVPEYSTRRFVFLLSVTVVASVLVVSMMTSGLNYLFPARTVYQQLVVSDAQQCRPGALCSITSAPWVKINHTLTVSGNRVESTISVSALLQPSPSPSNITITTQFDPVDNLVPTFTSGNLSWQGEMHQGQTVELRATFTLEQNGRYYISGSAVSSAPYEISGGRSNYYLFVENGVISKVSDHIDISTSVTTRVKGP